MSVILIYKFNSVSIQAAADVKHLYLDCGKYCAEEKKQSKYIGLCSGLGAENFKFKLKK